MACYSCQRLNCGSALIGWKFCSEGQKQIKRGTEKWFHAKKTVIGVSDFGWDSIPPSVSHLKGEAGGFEVMLELMLLYPSLGLSCPLATYADGDRWKVWTRN